MIPTALTLFEVDGSITDAIAFLDEVPSLDQLRAVMSMAIPPADSEHVYVNVGGQRRDMFVNENAIALGLPRNNNATAIYRAGYMVANPGTDPETLPAVHGPAFLFDRRVWS